MPARLSLVASDGGFLDPRNAPPTIDRRPMIERAREFLNLQGVSFSSPGPGHLKIEEINFYAPKGTITIDGEGASPGKGVDLLAQLCRERGFCP